MARTLEIVGEKWALLAVREVFLGNRRHADGTAGRLGGVLTWRGDLAGIPSV